MGDLLQVILLARRTSLVLAVTAREEERKRGREGGREGGTLRLPPPPIFHGLWYKLTRYA